MEDTRIVTNEAAMKALGADLVQRLRPGAVVLLEGPLGAGKTTLVRGALAGLGVSEPVRSPTFNLLQSFETTPPVLHADLYRVKSHRGIGIEDYLSTHVLFVEWPDRAAGLVEEEEAWHVEIAFDPDMPGSRRVTIRPPSTMSSQK